jgi:transporter family-2 protein
MSNKGHLIPLELMAAATGILIAIQARANGQLSHLMKNNIEAALVSFSTGLIAILAVTFFNPAIRGGITRLRSAVKARSIAKWRLFAGALGGAAIATQTHTVPLIGVALYSVTAIAGQTAISLFVDKVGLGGGSRQHISPRRVIAAAITVAAILISVFDKLRVSTFSASAVILSTLAGCVIGIQRALNGSINVHSGQSYTTSLLNFVMGTLFLLIFMLVMMVVRGDHIYGLPTHPWWIYLGGVTGVIYIAMASTVVQHLGVLTFTLFSVGGQLVGSLVLDLIVPTPGASVTGYLVTGIVMTYIGVLAGGQSALFKRRP